MTDRVFTDPHSADGSCIPNGGSSRRRCLLFRPSSPLSLERAQARPGCYTGSGSWSRPLLRHFALACGNTRRSQATLVPRPAVHWQMTLNSSWPSLVIQLSQQPPDWHTGSICGREPERNVRSTATVKAMTTVTASPNRPDGGGLDRVRLVHSNRKGYNSYVGSEPSDNQ